MVRRVHRNWYRQTLGPTFRVSMRNQQAAKRNMPAVAVANTLGAIRQWVASTPIGAFVAVSATLLLAESISLHAFFERWPSLVLVESVVETAINLAIVLPVVVFLIILPSARNLRSREAAEAALTAEREALDRRVHERTAELEAANTRLRTAMEEWRNARQAIEFQARLLDAVEQAVIATDGAGRIQYWNRYAEVLYGWGATEVCGRYVRDVVTLIDADGRLVDPQRLCRADGSWSGEVEATGRTEQSFPAYLACSRLPMAGDEHVLVSFDMSPLKQAESARRDTEATYTNLVENAPTGVCICQGGRLVFVNPKFAKLLGYSRSVLLKVPLAQVVHPNDREWVGWVSGAQTDGGLLPEDYQGRLLTQSGEIRWAEMHSARIRHRGEPAILVNVQDVTERRRLEDQLHELSARLMTVQEEERRRVARDLHDSLGQKLTGIKFLIESALGAPWPDERRSGVEQLSGVIPAIQDIVEEVRRIATELHPSILDDLGLLPTIVWYLREFGKAHPELTIDEQLEASDSDVPRPLRTPIYRILQEASNNIAKHGGASRITVGLATRDGKLRLWIGDNGVGFDPGVLPTGAGGIGMRSMRERVELSGGEFSASSAPGGGTTILAEWPLEALVSA